MHEEGSSQLTLAGMIKRFVLLFVISGISAITATLISKRITIASIKEKAFLLFCIAISSVIFF